MTDLFDFVKSINEHKENIMTDENEGVYAPFVVNRTLSYFVDCIFSVNELNIRRDMSSRMQYGFLLNRIRQKKRFARWAKPEVDERVELIMRHYQLNQKRSKVLLGLLSEEQIEAIRAQEDKGGVKDGSEH
jgi:hypothetical protein